MIRIPSQARAGIAGALAALLSAQVDAAHIDAIIWLLWGLGGLLDWLLSAPDRNGDGVPDALGDMFEARGISPDRLRAWLSTARDTDLLFDALRHELGQRGQS